MCLVYGRLSNLSFRIALNNSKQKNQQQQMFSNEWNDIPTFKTATQRIVDIFLINLFRSSEHRMMRIVYAPLKIQNSKVVELPRNMANKFISLKPN